MLVKEIVIPLDNPFWNYSSNFNPSILHIYDNIYLLAFRSFRRYSETNTQSHGLNHPWLGGIDSYSWWQAESEGYVGTGFLILQIIGTEVTILQVFKESMSQAVDMRLSNINGQIVSSYNEYLDPKTNDLNIGLDRSQYDLPSGVQECCFIIKGRTLGLSVESSVYKLEALDMPKILCQNVTGYTEKNWSLWNYNKQMMISYYLVPKHIVFKPDNDKCEVLFENGSNILSQIKNYYRFAVEFSLSTPAVPLSATRYLGVGHLKVYPTAIVSSNTKAWISHLKLVDLPGHPIKGIRYFMFFYTFDPGSLSILQISHSFLPPDTNSNVVFPVGLVVEPNRIIVSYGEQDNQMKLLFLSIAELNEMLRSDITPETFDFIRY